MYKGRTKKSTCLSTTWETGEFRACRFCDGQHVHESSEGKTASGEFRTRALETYPPELCEELARAAIATCELMKKEGSGPGGWRRCTGEKARISNWSRWAGDQPGEAVAILNEAGLRGKHVVIDERQKALSIFTDHPLGFGVAVGGLG